MTVPRLIEVALPIREISAESVRDKSLRHGHISTLHLWFARRPLAASRAVVFASLVPDPDHPECPPAFRAAVEHQLKTHVPDVLKSYRRGRVTHMDPDPYRPYDGQEDTLRNRLLMFIAKWSPEWLAFEQGKSKTEPKPENLLDDRSLVKWETSGPTTKIGSKEVPNEVGKKILWIARELIRVANGNQIPTVLDPFSGGGAIPLEAGRVGAQPIANDYNPVAYMMLRATCEFPQKYGKPGKRSKTTTSEKPGLFGDSEAITVPNVLACDVQYYAQNILRRAKEKVGHLYPVGKDKHPIVGYIWVRTAPCSNLSCKAEIPLLSSLLICNKSDKKVALSMKVSGKQVHFGIVKNEAIQSTTGTMLNRGNCRCPVCQQPTPVKDLRAAGLDNKMSERLVAVIVDTPTGKDYRSPQEQDRVALEQAGKMAAEAHRPSEPILPEITRKGDDEEDVSNSTGIRVHLYGFKTWGSLFNARQLVAVNAFVDAFQECEEQLKRAFPQDRGYQQAVLCMLAMWFDRVVTFKTNAGRWIETLEAVTTPFSLAKISMEWQYPEVNPFNDSTGGASGQLDWIIRVIERESGSGTSDRLPAKVMLGDATAVPLPQHSLDAVVTDPPYFDAISYADISDIFYVWLKLFLGNAFPEAVRTPSTPKSDEATALKHRHQGDGDAANQHFCTKLVGAFSRASYCCKPDGVVSVMFAHQTVEAWTALIHSILGSGLNITASFPIDTERGNRPRGIDSSALASSITVVCRPRLATPPGSFKDVRREIERVVKQSVKRFWDYGFRGADLIVACYGPAVGEFGKYERVERGDGQPVTVPELLQLVREAALKAIAGEFTGDQLSRLYFVWANLYGVSEQPWDDVRLVVQIGGESENAMEVATGRGLFVVDGANSRLAVLADRADRAHLGKDSTDPLIDQLHRAMLLWKAEDRAALVQYLHGHDLGDHVGFWRLAQALFEVMPRDAEDWRLVSALLGERNTLRTEIKRREAALAGAPGLFDGQEE
jgi:adenine-specific DNA methylase